MRSNGVGARRHLLLLCLFASALLAPGARAQGARQEPALASSVTTATASSVAVAPAGAHKVDEFGNVRGCDHSARLDNFAIALQNEPDAVGYIVVYGPEGKGSGSGDFRMRVTEGYFIHERGVDGSRLKTIYGGRYKEPRESATELWLVPPGVEPPVPASYVNNEVHGFTGMFAEVGAWDSISMGESMGPPIGDVTTAAFADMLNTRRDTRAHLVVYHGADSTPGMWRRVSARQADELTKSYGVAAERISIVFAGYREEAGVELWILPKDAPSPVEPAVETRKPSEATQLGDFSRFDLSFDENEHYVFKGFADLLREDAALRAYIIIRTEAGGEPPETSDPDEFPNINLVKLVEKWKKELTEQYGIGEERLVVIVAPLQDEWETGEVETWIVPPGADPPDPYAEDEAPEAEEEQEEPDEPAQPAVPDKPTDDKTPPARQT